MYKNQRGFTLPELIAAAVLLLAALITTAIVLAPKAYTTEIITAERRMVLAVIGQAVNRYYAGQGALPPEITTKPTLIGSQDEQIDLCHALVPTYAYDLPVDPLAGATADKKTEAHTEKRCLEEDVVYMTGVQVSKSQDGTRLILQLALPIAGQQAGDKLVLTFK